MNGFYDRYGINGHDIRLPTGGTRGLPYFFWIPLGALKPLEVYDEDKWA